MSATTENGVYFLLAGATLLLVAGVAVLLRDTRGLPLRSRASAMMAKAGAGFVWTLPCRKWVTVVAAFFAGLLGGSLACFAVCFGLLSWYASTLPVATEAHEGIGDAITAMCWAALSLLLSLVVGVITGFALAERTHRRLFPPTG